MGSEPSDADKLRLAAEVQAALDKEIAKEKAEEEAARRKADEN